MRSLPGSFTSTWVQRCSLHWKHLRPAQSWHCPEIHRDRTANATITLEHRHPWAGLPSARLDHLQSSRALVKTLNHAVLTERAGPVAGLCHLWTLSPPAGSAGLQHAGCSASWHVHPHAELVASFRPAVCCGWPEHLLHSHCLHPPLPGEREAPGGAAAPLGADSAQSEAGLRGAAVPEAGRAGTGQRPLVWPDCVAVIYPSAAAYDPSVPCELRVRLSSSVLFTTQTADAKSNLNVAIKMWTQKGVKA